MGAFLGALITGGIALLIYYNQNSKERERDKRFEEKEEADKFERFLREYFKLKHFQRNISNGVQNILIEKEKAKPENYELFVTTLKKNAYEIHSIKEEEIPHDIFPNFLNIKRASLRIIEILDGNTVMKESYLEKLENMSKVIKRNFDKVTYYKDGK